MTDAAVTFRWDAFAPATVAVALATLQVVYVWLNRRAIAPLRTRRRPFEAPADDRAWWSSAVWDDAVIAMLTAFVVTMLCAGGETPIACMFMAPALIFGGTTISYTLVSTTYSSHSRGARTKGRHFAD